MKNLNEFYKFLICIINVFVFSACQSIPDQFYRSTQPELYDDGFISARNIQVEPELDIFNLDEAAKEFVRNTIGPIKSPSRQLEALIYAVFDRSKMNLLYRGDANTLANNTFHARAANCLSMSIMMYALAKQAEFDVNFQEIMIPEYWTRRQGYSLLNGHINLRIGTKVPLHAFSFQRRDYQVDFDPQSSRKSLPKKLVSKQDVIAMFYNNKGADALLKNNFELAYAYFREAILRKPSFQSAWINMGILYRHKGYFLQAEQAYLYALNLDDGSLTAWENLAHLYNYTNREDEAQKIFYRVESQRKNNPYYHLNLGEEQIERKNWDEALTHFKKALTLDRSRHEVYFGLARVYFQFGELQRSERYLKQAKSNAKSRQVEGVYQSKLDFLQNL